jgi:hypothetical protein
MAIPYATWANRGRGQMNVWLARSEAAARPTPFPTVASTSKLTTSPMQRGRSKNAAPMIDGEEPRNSAEGGSSFDWWPMQGWSAPCDAQAPAASPAAGQTAANTPAPAQGQGRQCSKGEWIEMTFAKASSVSRSEIYWFDDEANNGGVRVPASWKLLYKDGEQWKPVETSDALGTAKDTWNTVTFKPVTTTALRLEIVMRPGISAGVQEWKVK